MNDSFKKRPEVLLCDELFSPMSFGYLLLYIEGDTYPGTRNFHSE